MVVTQKQLSECLGLSLRRVQQLRSDGIIQKDEDARGYDLATCVQAYIAYKLESETGKRKAVDAEGVKLEHARIKMEISKLKLKRLRRESFDARAIEASWTSFLIYISGKLDTLGSKIIMASAGADINEQIRIADDIIAELKQELYDYDPKDVEDEDLYDDEDDDEDDDDEDDYD